MDQDPNEAIANAIWHRCEKWIDCRTSELEPAAMEIISYLKKRGYKIVKA